MAAAMIHRIRPGMMALAAAFVALVALPLMASAAAAQGAAQENDDPTVRGVLFFSPTCGHCEYVINSVLPPLFEENGGPWQVYYDAGMEDDGIPFYLLDNGTLQFLMVDVSVEAGSALFVAATDHYDLESFGVPRMIVADEVYVGSAEIPDSLPGLISDGLGGDGIGWPSAPGVEEAVATIPIPEPTTTTTAADPGDTTTTGPGHTSTTAGGRTTTTTTVAGGGVLPTGGDSVADRFGRDPAGNTLAVIVLLGMLASLAGVAVIWRRPNGARRPGIAVPIIAAFGIAVAAYLSYVETSGSEAVCGPVGDCNTVQQSEYAELFGLIPIGVLGLIGYVIVVGAWLIARAEHNPASGPARIALFAGTVAGVVFSIYLTFLEPFVIGATCAWCLTSAVIITGLMWLAAGPAADSWAKLRR
jgi:uncharacterized membrane protein